MALRTELISFGFLATRSARSEGCQAIVDETDLNLIYKVEGSPEVEITPRPPPGKKEPRPALKADGWEEILGESSSGFRRAAEFEKVVLTVSLSCICRCIESKADTTKHLKWEISYDRKGTGGPKATLTDTRANDKIQPSHIRTTPTATPGESKVAEMWTFDVLCQCPNSKPCAFSFSIAYTFRSVAGPD